MQTNMSTSTSMMVKNISMSIYMMENTTIRIRAVTTTNPFLYSCYHVNGFQPQRN